MSTLAQSNPTAHARLQQLAAAGIDPRSPVGFKYLQTGNTIPYALMSQPAARQEEPITTSSSSRSSGGSSSVSPADLRNIELLNLAMGGIDNDYQIGLQRLADQYTQGINRMQSERAQNEYESGQQVRDNTRSLGSNEWNVLKNTGRSMGDLARLLGAYGVTGSDQLNATDAVTSDGNQQMGQARTTFARNARDIDDNLRRYVRQWETQRDQFNDNNASARADLLSNRNTNKINNLNQLATLYASTGQSGRATNAINEIRRLQNESATTQRAVRPTTNMTETPTLERRSLAEFIPENQSYFSTTTDPTTTSQRVGVAYSRRRRRA